MADTLNRCRKAFEAAFDAKYDAEHFATYSEPMYRVPPDRTLVDPHDTNLSLNADWIAFQKGYGAALPGEIPAVIGLDDVVERLNAHYKYLANPLSDNEKALIRDVLTILQFPKQEKYVESWTPEQIKAFDERYGASARSGRQKRESGYLCEKHQRGSRAEGAECFECYRERVSHAPSEELVADVEEYLHWRKVNPQIKGGENYLKRLRQSLPKRNSIEDGSANG